MLDLKELPAVHILACWMTRAASCRLLTNLLVEAGVELLLLIIIIQQHGVNIDLRLIRIFQLLVRIHLALGREHVHHAILD